MDFFLNKFMIWIFDLNKIQEKNNYAQVYLVQNYKVHKESQSDLYREHRK